MQQHFQRTRIAPTPSGFLHLGNAYSFALTAAIAAHTGAKTLLRIDDMDRDRVEPAYVQDIFDTLDFLGIPWHEGPRSYDEYVQTWSQRHRMPLYQHALEQLKADGHLFACSCSRTQVLAASPSGIYPGTCRHKHLPFDGENVCWRLNTRDAKQVSINTYDTGKGTANFPASMTDMVIRKKDGDPAYQLTSVIDDQHFGVDLIIRGQDLWDSTLAQSYLATLLPGSTFGRTTFYHHPLLTRGAEKLSKSAGSMSIQHMRREGMTAAGVYKAISSMAGINHSVTNWEDIGKHCLI